MSIHLEIFGRREAHLIEATLALGAIASPAFGQAVRNENVNELSLSADITHESNVARSDLLGATLRDITPSDERLTLGLNLDVRRGLGRNTLAVHGLIGYDFYRRNSELNRERLGLGADAGVRAGPCQFNLRGRIDRGQSDLATIYFLNQPGLGSVKNTETTVTYGGDVNCGRLYGANPMIGYERTTATNSDDLRKVSNYHRDHYYGGLAYDDPVLGRYTITLDRSNISYPNRAGGPLAQFAGYRNNALRFTGERRIGSVVTARFGAGYNWVKPRIPATQDFKGFSWNLAATVLPVSRLQLTLSTSRAIEPSLGEEALYSIDRQYAVIADYALTSRTSLNAQASYSRRSFRGSTGLFGPRLDEDRLFRASGGVTMAFSRRLSISAIAGYEKRNATGSIYDYDNTYIGLRSKFVL